MKNKKSKKSENVSSRRGGGLGALKRLGIGWFWPVFGFCAVLILSWLIHVESGYWSNKLEANLAKQAGPISSFGEVVVHGRDIELRGSVPSEETKAQLEAAARQTRGVRKVTSALEVFAPAETAPAPDPKLVVFAPKVRPYRGSNRRPSIQGSWPHGSAGTLQVKLAGRTYVQGESKALAVAGGRFTLTPDSDLADGKYDIEVAVKLSDGVLRDKTRGEVTIDGTPPEQPTVGVFVGISEELPVRGSWDVGDGETLEVKLDNKTYILGQSPSFVSDSAGNWTLVPHGGLKPGIYDVVVRSTDQYGNVSTDVSENELVIGNVASSTQVKPQTPGGVRPIAMGQWGGGAGQTFEVVLDGKTYRLGVDEELTSDGEGSWFLSPDIDIADGEYELTIRAIGADGPNKIFSTTRKVVIDKSSPAPPKVETYSGFESPSQIAGTWDEKEAVSLVVSVAGKRAVLGEDEALTTNGAGKWLFKLDDPLDPGNHDVLVVSSDAAGNASEDQTLAEISIKPREEAKLPQWYAVLDDGGVVLHGTIPNDIDQDELARHVGKKLPNAQISDRTEQALNAGEEGWFKAAALGLDQLTRLNVGSVQLQGKSLTVIGDAKNKTDAEKIKSDVETRLPKGFEASFSLTANSGPDAVECQEKINAIMAGKSIRFVTGTAELAKASVPLLKKLSDVAKLCRQRVIEIAGHTDSSGSVDANLKLSQQRAKAVAEFFASETPDGLSLNPVGFGETRPIASNKTLAGRKKNRRIEFLVMP